MRKDIMVDLETLGTDENASIFQIAAMSFNIETGEIYDEINLIGDVSTYRELSVDGSTLKWWVTTDSELFSLLLKKGNLSENEMLTKFNDWIISQCKDIKDIYLWGNGILFDNAKLQKNLNKIEKLSYPIFFRNDRDVRTIVELATFKSEFNEEQLKLSVSNENERKHDAYDDVKFQIRLVNKCYDILMK